jgi:hypothetical protein
MTMTTERNLEHLSGANRKRDKHPARSARILTTGFSIAAVLGLTTGYSAAATKKVDDSAAQNNVEPTISQLELLQGLVAQIPKTSATAVQNNTTAALAISSPESAVPAMPLQLQTQPQRIQIQVPTTPNPATTSSGSK